VCPTGFAALGKASPCQTAAATLEGKDSGCMMRMKTG
jgi:hypothetical protein